jgi:hypothetical protein
MTMHEQSALKQYVQTLQQLTTSPKDLTVSFNNFPYPLHESLQSALVHSSHVALQQPELLARSQYSAINKPVISLFGPRGTELYQEQLCKALAHHYSALFVDFDIERLDLKEHGEQREMSGQGGLLEALAQLQDRSRPDEDDERKPNSRAEDEDELEDETEEQDEAAYFDRLMRRSQRRPPADEAALAMYVLTAVLTRVTRLTPLQSRAVHAAEPRADAPHLTRACRGVHSQCGALRVQATAARDQEHGLVPAPQHHAARLRRYVWLTPVIAVPVLTRGQCRRSSKKRRPRRKVRCKRPSSRCSARAPPRKTRHQRIPLLR